MAVGLPVLGIRSPGVSDTVEDEVTGLLSSDDLAAFTAKMVRLATGHEQRKRMGQAARRAVDIYHIDRTTDLIVSHYQRLIECASQRRRSARHPNVNTWQKRRP
jgi:glycosyltransferase involved in cell wall biosynthesis